MNKLFSLIKVSFNHDMNLFKINTKKQSKFSKFILPLLFTIYIMFLAGIYAEKLMGLLEPLGLAFVVLTVFAVLITFLTLMEGIYKSGSLLFNAKDDNLMLSLPVKKSTVLFIRIFKFYAFEFLYNSLFLLPVMGIYAWHINPGFSYYISSLVALMMLPVVPIVLSCIIGFIITYLSSKFKGKNLFQTIFSMGFVLLVLYFSYNADGFVNKLIEKASSLNDLITRLYYPVGAYITLVTDFDILTLLIYILIHVALFLVTVLVLGRLYFRVNSGIKKVLTGHKHKKFAIKKQTRMMAFVKKELNKFFLTPVFITNAGFGLVLFIIACILFSSRFELLAQAIASGSAEFDVEMIKSWLSVIMFGLVCFSALMTSITSSMISLEGKAFGLLKSLPLKPLKIVLYKVIAALVIMIPCILIGDIIVFTQFKFDIISIILIIIASFLLPIVSELMGIMINLKYPKMDASNDTEVVKQSMSSMVATFSGMGLAGATFILLFIMLGKGINNNLIMMIFLLFYGIIGIILWILLKRNCCKHFNNITF